MQYAVVFAPEAAEQLAALYTYISEAASPNVAANYTDAIIHTCEGLQNFPQRGTPRDDVRPGLRTTHHKKRTVIAYAIQNDRVTILGVFYGGQDFERILESDSDHNTSAQEEASAACRTTNQKPDFS